MGASDVRGDAEKRSIEGVGVLQPVFKSVLYCRIIEVDFLVPSLAELGEEGAVDAIVRKIGWRKLVIRNVGNAGDGEVAKPSPGARGDEVMEGVRSYRTN